MWAVSRITQLPVTCALPPLDSKERVAAAHQHRVRCPERLLHGGLGRRGARDVERAHVHAALHERLALLRAELLEVVRGLSKARLECVSSRPAWGLLVRGSSPVRRTVPRYRRRTSRGSALPVSSSTAPTTSEDDIMALPAPAKRPRSARATAGIARRVCDARSEATRVQAEV